MEGLSGWRQGSDFVGKFWPNGEFGLGFQKRVDCSQKINKLPEPVVDVKSPHWRAFACRMALYQRECNETGQSIPALGLSPHINSHKRAKRGSKGISSFGRKMVRNGAYLLQRRYGCSRLSFLTLTLPAVSRSESEQIAESWSELVRKYLQSLGRLLKSRSLPAEIVGCTEIQESRTERDGVLGLHLHVIFCGRAKRGSWAISYKEARMLWKRELERIVPRELDCTSTENLERVKNDAEQYLGKYMSKGIKSMQRLVEMGFGDILPSAWWCMTMSLKRAVKSSVEHLTGERASLFVRLVENGAEVFLYSKPVEVQLSDGQSIKVGYFGKVLSEFLYMLRA
jgi:hypothetical protein